MPQRHLPFFPAGVTDITPELALPCIQMTSSCA